MALPFSGKTILIVDDEVSIRNALGGALQDEGCRVRTAADGPSALQAIAEQSPDIVLLDIWMPGLDGLEVLKNIKDRQPDLPVIMISGHGTVETAVRATKLGAFDFIEKPLSLDRVILAIRHALDFSRLTLEYRRLKKQAVPEPELLGSSKAIQELKATIEKVAPSEGWVLITGENGTGKEVAARAVHRLSRRQDGPFADVNCAAIPEELIESELFGHEKGSFTGATARKSGKFEAAHTGTLFLDEIGDMSLKTQSKVLRVLQEQAFERVGGTEPIRVDVRVIAATNKGLEAEIAAGRFREDLYYRLNVIPLHLPALRERREDIPGFIEHFLAEFCRRSGIKTKRMHKKVLAALTQYAWPGNVRELRNIIERMVILSQGPEIMPADLPPVIGLSGLKSGESPFDRASLKDARTAFEKEFIIKKLMEHDYQIVRTAQAIGINRVSLHRKIKSYGIKLGEPGEG
jgi:two-component system, NtrC family, nitrogen regulation response regulator NtrX